LFILYVIGVAARSWQGRARQREDELKKILVLFIGVVLLAGCAVNRYRGDFDFANKLAEEGLWKEAYYRMQKALPKNTDSPALHNNLAVVLEGLNRLPEAEREYQRALKLAPKNATIQTNYERFKKNQRKNENEK
jgi:tetratricopeptide (TPR) repeat protein